MFGGLPPFSRPTINSSVVFLAKSLESKLYFGFTKAIISGIGMALEVVSRNTTGQPSLNKWYINYNFHYKQSNYVIVTV